MTAGRKLHLYEFIEKIGEGGMAEVWKARHLKLGCEARPGSASLSAP